MYVLLIGIECTHKWNVEILTSKIGRSLSIIIVYVPNFDATIDSDSIFAFLCVGFLGKQIAKLELIAFCVTL